VTPTPKILIAGYYGFGNAGDEAILESLVAGLRRDFSEAQITVFSGDPARTEGSHGVSAVPWLEPEAIQSAVQESDRVIIGGGGLFHDYWGVNPERLFLDGNGGMGLYLAVALWAALY
jgi:polysaccharide pyruvyl transferase WcaK-like protein